MKNKKIIIISITIGTIIIIGIILGVSLLVKNLFKNDIYNSNSQYNIYSKSFGEYQVSKSLIEIKDSKSDNKFFYLKKADKDNLTPNNISVSSGKTDYPIEESDNLKYSILNNLSTQLNNRKDVTITSDGSITANSYILYTFSIYEKNNNITTTQYYIIGNYKYVLIQQTSFERSDEMDKYAYEIVDSFKWNGE